MTPSIAFWLASALSFVTFGVHTFVGGVYAARPLLAAPDLPRAARWLNYYCWHITTVLLVYMTGGFAWAALSPQGLSVAWFLTALAPALSVLSVGVALRGGVNPIRFPSTTLFALIFIAAAIGVARTF